MAARPESHSGSGTDAAGATGGAGAGELAGVRGLAAWVPAAIADHAPRITVVGDAMLDGWWTGTIERFCREAPAPVVDITRRDYAAGGAANTAMNLAALGARVRICGLIGNDDAGHRLRAILDGAGVDTTDLCQDERVGTTTKYRILGGDQVMLRIDDTHDGLPADAIRSLADRVPGAVAGADAVVVCDYGSGALGPEVRAALAPESGIDPDILIVVDAHDTAAWAEICPDIVTPNAAEAAQVLALRLDPRSDRVAVVTERRSELLAATNAAAVVVTLDRDGTVLLTGNGGHRTWAKPATEKQASGAGDTFVASLTAARAAGLPLTTSLDLAQAAADVVVHRPGTSVCTTADLAEHLQQFADTALATADLLRRVEEDRSAGRRIVLTNGCFDVLHRGHTRYLNQAKQLGDVLVVALNDDAGVRRLKGPDRPINPIADRAGIIASLSCVDYVTVFSTDTLVPLIELLKPDVYAKGGDYTAQMLEETPAVEACGGRVRILDYVPERSTAAVVRRIRSTRLAGDVP
ncbi:bifunctional heptose 7-phosphate kinase/heptose 1-phosphate adenyltransferase [Arthrobacter agilis]|uniref:PfkB family carbohydrate kinase n=1 Tax=Arthrobacter agilis TaxID=37921 RepID=UPI000B35A15C|nr:PfkB family carbohydrate kinase [Arthrobacter agilis]OUM44263.1 bifunctional heptose 7-phosphate kinase/heptose 1-phosphate adenyltransferase [Arthrobacter agilis]PPB46639.1 bifunctional heptose 7-phosphate kinase/heptose 1-phosphate adenyltransferase [Arthrobacter agilis]TPV23762.1 bifunctional heptose 7-phosphate kinase/heptose 1-phosphate adenyltransferase [Arthrobacter agilis]VDR32492.1 Bifunctional protein hldE [Arthrobacter agilis]